MKTAIILFSVLVGCASAYSQTEAKKDTTRISVGKKQISMVKGSDGTEVKVEDKESTGYSENTVTDEPTNKEKNKIKIDPYKKSSRKSKSFEGHWGGIDIGLNNYLTKKQSLDLPSDDEFMNLNIGRSINVNLNVLEKEFAIIGNKFGLVTGLGIDFYNYFFDDKNTITKNFEGVIVEKDFYSNRQIVKSKLAITYLSIPLILEWQLPGNSPNVLRIAGGVIGDLKIESHTKVVYHENGDRRKEKERNNFNLNAVRYGFTGRIGSRHTDIFCNYFPVSLFQKNKGPELYPITIGISIFLLKITKSWLIGLQYRHNVGNFKGK